MQSPFGRDRGIGRYLVELALALDRLPSRHLSGYVIQPGTPIDERLSGLDRTRRLFDPLSAKAFGAGAYHIGSAFELGMGLEAVWLPWLQRAGVPLMVTLYDLIPLLFPSRYLRTRSLQGRYRERIEVVRRAERVLAVSKCTAADAIRVLNIPSRRVVVVGAGVSDRFAKPMSVDVAFEASRRALPWLEPGFILHVGGADWRKNTGRLIEAYAKLPGRLTDAHQLVVACRLPVHHRLPLRARSVRRGVRRRVNLVGFVPDELLVHLYQSCGLFVFPSLYEGFGLPVAEAMACGAPTIVSDASCLPELVPNPEARFDGRSTEAILTALRRALESDSLREKFRLAGNRHDWNWAGVARRTEAVYAEVLQA